MSDVSSAEPSPFDLAVSRLRRILDGLRSDGSLAALERDREVVYQRYQPLFSPAALPRLSEADFATFLSYKHNKHWTGLERGKARLMKDMPLLRTALSILVDESRDLEERFGEALGMVVGLGQAKATAVLHVALPAEHGVLNRVSRTGLESVSLWPAKGRHHHGATYVRANAVFRKLADSLGVDLWVLDTLWDNIGGRHDPESPDHAKGITPTYLLTWNPSRWPWEDLVEQADRVMRGEPVESAWSTGNSTRPQSGDRFYILRQGVEPRGIMASGRFTSGVSVRPHWDPERAAVSETHKGAGIVFDELVAPDEREMLDLEELEEYFPDDSWTPQSSGTEIRPEILTLLEYHWQWHLTPEEAGPVARARSANEILDGVSTFAAASRAAHKSAEFALWHPAYMVFDEGSGVIAPAKWCGLAGITAEVYMALQRLQREETPRGGFDGTRTRKSVEGVLGVAFQADAELSERFRRQCERDFGSDAIGDRDLGSLRFVTLRAPSYWWVNQGKTYEEELEGGFVWAPQKDKRGAQLFHWTNVSKIARGDIVFSYRRGKVCAISRATSDGEEAEKPSRLSGASWGADGWKAEVDYQELEKPVGLRAISDDLLSLNLSYGPINTSGGVNQGYLYGLTPEAADLILREAGAPLVPSRDDRSRGWRERRKLPLKPKNIILYGPPGTGKTWHTVSRAVELCDGTAPAERADTQARFEELREKNRIAFVTFHQSFGYEEFVEGIRPVLSSEAGADSAGSDVKFEVHAGVFKRMCALARAGGQVRADTSWRREDGGRVWKMSLGEANSPEAHIYDECVENGYMLLGYGGQIDFSSCETEEDFAKTYRAEEPEVGSYGVSVVYRFWKDLSVGDLVIVTDGNRRFRAIGEIAGDAEHMDRDDGMAYRQRRNVKWLALYDPSLPAEQILSKHFTQQTLYELKRSTLKDEELMELLTERRGAEGLPHVLIIDEINRGNVSKILGELITLLEPDKRAGMPNQLAIELPYSGERFSVPPNLHVLGTMNTADRSIAFLDTALRRRFDFEELMPDPEVLRRHLGERGVLGSVDVAEILDRLNQRIEILFDRDHTLGHAYFLGCESLADLRTAFVDRVVPLLQEYFYGDWPKVAMVLACPQGEAGAPSEAANAYPLLKATALPASIVPGGESMGLENAERWAVNPAFLGCAEGDLPHFFDGLMGG